MAESELTEKLAELVKAVATHNKGGTLTFRIKVAPAKGDLSTVFVSDEVTLKAPEGVRSESIFFIDGDDYSLRRNDPNQLSLRIERAGATADPEDSPDA